MCLVMANQLLEQYAYIQGTLLPPPFELVLAFWDKAEADMDMGQMWCSKAGHTPTNLSSADQLIFAHFAKL